MLFSAVSMSTALCADLAIAMCRALLKRASVSITAPRTCTLSSSFPAHGMAMAESTLIMQSVTVSSKIVNAWRNVGCPSIQ
jgi:hypothetical protein